MTCHNIFNNKKDFVSASCFVRKYAYCSFKLRRGDTLLAITPNSLKKGSQRSTGAKLPTFTSSTTTSYLNLSAALNFVSVIASHE